MIAPPIDAGKEPALVADVGGSNTRVALVDAQGGLHGLARYANQNFASFDAVLEAYLAGCPVGAVSGCAVAIAGPVTSDQARLTNLDWAVSATGIARSLPGLEARNVRLVNDLAALGHGLGTLRADQIARLRTPQGRPRDNAQALVVGLGTGFNVCAVRAAPQTPPQVFEAEMGHASLPLTVWRALRDEIGDAVAEFSNVEALFSGRGIAHLYAIVSGGDVGEGGDIVGRYGAPGARAATRTVDLTVHLLGILARELVFQYLPLAGVHFAGSVARGVLGSGARPGFLDAFQADAAPMDLAQHVPVSVIVDDAAALTGLARLAPGSGPAMGQTPPFGGPVQRPTA